MNGRLAWLLAQFIKTFNLKNYSCNSQRQALWWPGREIDDNRDNKEYRELGQIVSDKYLATYMEKLCYHAGTSVYYWKCFWNDNSVEPTTLHSKCISTAPGMVGITINHMNQRDTSSKRVYFGICPTFEPKETSAKDVKQTTLHMCQVWKYFEPTSDASAPAGKEVKLKERESDVRGISLN